MASIPVPKTKTERLLASFASVELLPEHYNHGDQTRWLRHYGVATSVASKLIKWGDQIGLVCTFENRVGVYSGAYSWKDEFLRAAVLKHLELFGEAGRADLTPELLALIEPNRE